MTESHNDLADIKRKVEEVLGDAPQLLKLALENVLREHDPHADAQPGSAGRVGRQSGKVSELTAIAPLKPGGADRLRRIFKLVNGNFAGAQKVATLHDMRFVFFENDTKILFATTYDGDWDTYIDDFATKIPDLMDLLFSSVEGWPGIKDPGVKDFIAGHQLTADGWYVANPHLSVVDTRRLQRINDALQEFLDKVSGHVDS
jgi:hypothetical protein